MWARLCSVLIGYAFGNILSAELVAKHYNKSLFEEGSLNPGMANAGRVLGKKAGAYTLIGDILKTAVAILVCWLLFGKDIGRLVVLYAGLGATLGHDFPIWHHFHGGKGVACIVVTNILYSIPFGLASAAAGLVVVLLHGGLKWSAVLISWLYSICMYIWGPVNAAGVREAFWVSIVLAGLMTYKNLQKTPLDAGYKGKLPEKKSESVLSETDREKEVV